MNPALIAQSVPEPQPVQQPVQLAEGVNRVQQLQQQTQLGQQQLALAPVRAEQAQANVQETQLGNQQKQQQLTDQQNFAKAIREGGGDPDKTDALADQTISDPWLLSRIHSLNAETRVRNATVTAAQHKQFADHSARLAGQVQSVIDAPDSPTRTSLWGKLYDDATTLTDEKGNKVIPPNTLDRNTVPDNGALNNVLGYLDSSKEFQTRQAEIKEKLALSAKNSATAAKETAQEHREAIRNRYQGVATPEQHDAWQEGIKRDYPDVAQEYANLPFDPESTPDSVQNMALTANQTEQSKAAMIRANAQQTRANLSGGRWGAFARATDPTLTDAERATNMANLEAYDRSAGGPTSNAQLIQQRYLQKRADNDTKLHTTLGVQKQTEQALSANYGAALAKAGVAENESDPDKLNQTITDPKTTKDITAAQAINLMKASRAKAQAMADQQDQIEKRQQWGKYSPPAPAAQPAAAPATRTPSPAPNQPASPTRAAAPTGKTFPRSAIPGLAAKNKMTPQQAETQLLNQGYTIQ